LKHRVLREALPIHLFRHLL